MLNKLEMEERLRRTLLAHCEKDAKANAELGSYSNTEREVLFQLWKLESFDELKGFVSEIGTLRKLCTSGSSCDLLIHCVSVARTAWKVPIKIEWDALEYLAMASHGIDQTSVMHTIRSLLAVADVLHLLGEAAHGQAEVFYRAALGGWLGGDKAVCLAKLATVRRCPFGEAVGGLSPLCVGCWCTPIHFLRRSSIAYGLHIHRWASAVLGSTHATQPYRGCAHVLSTSVPQYRYWLCSLSHFRR